MGKYPFTVQILTAGAITTAGDLVAQTITKKKHDRYDLRRTAVMSAFGFCYFGPVCTSWLALLNRMKVSPLRSLIIDQSVAAPIITAGFVLLHPVLSGKPWIESRNNFKAQYISIMLKGWCLWIPAQ